MIENFNEMLIVKNKPKSHIGEAYRTLRTNIKFSSLDTFKYNNGYQCGSSRRKTTNTVNLALTIAESRKKVIIVNADLRRPLIHKVFNSDSKPGITNVLVDNKKLSEVIKRADEIDSNLYYIASGPIPPNPSELLGSEKMKSIIIEELKEQAHTLIFDSAPVIGFADSLVLANQVDGVVLILNAGVVTRDAAKQAKALLEKAKAKILGVVLNKVDIKREGYHYYYHYYNYSKYYKNLI